MKYFVLILSQFFTFTLIHAQGNYIHTSGRHILGPCGDTLLIQGVNYAPYNWGYLADELRLDQIAQNGANAVRLVWYTSNNAAPVYANLDALDSAITRCTQLGMIAIVELHDFTCSNDAAGLITGLTWWEQPEVINLLDRNRESVIVNISNESLYFNWGSNPAQSLSTYFSTYSTIISNLRAHPEFKFPLLIDAPDCGGSSDAFVTASTAANLIATDPEQNLIFSTHTYWYAQTNNDSSLIYQRLANVCNANIPLIAGEVANSQDDTEMCQYALNYSAVINSCNFLQMGWLIWCWDRDGCPDRQMSSDGNFAHLTTLGNDILNNSNYGWSAHPPQKSKYLTTADCSLGNKAINNSNFSVQISKITNQLNLSSTSTIQQIRLFDAQGKEFPLLQNGINTYYSNELIPGIYFLNAQDKKGNSFQQKFLVN